MYSMVYVVFMPLAQMLQGAWLLYGGETVKEIMKQKESIVDEIKEKIEKSQSAVFVDYRGLTVDEVTDLRNRFRAANVEYRVLKNTMLTRAADKLELEELKPFLAGPTAVAFGYDDAVAPAKIMADFIKEKDKTEIKCGILEGKVVDDAAVKALAALPPREELIAKALGSMQAPISNFVGVLNGTIRNLVYALNAVAEQKSAS